MPAPAKRVNILGATLKEESAYGGGGSISTSADGFQMQFADRNVGALANLHYDYDGKIGPSAVELGQLRRSPQTGRSIDVTLPFRFKGYGTAYDTSKVPTIHRIMKACGYTATLDATSGAEKWTYTPTPAATAPASLFGNLYARGLAYPVLGLLADLDVDGTKNEPWMFNAKANAILSGLPTDVSVPAITYPGTSLVHPLAVGTVITIGDFDPIVNHRGFKLANNRKISPRANQDATLGHSGFVGEERSPLVTVILEATALAADPGHTSSGLNPYVLKEKGTPVAVSIQGAGEQYNRLRFESAQATVVDVRETNDNSIALWEIDLEPFMTAPGANDDHCWVAD